MAVDDPLLHRLVNLKSEALFNKLLVKFIDQKINDRQEMLFFERVEDNDLINAVEKLRIKSLLEFMEDIFLDF